MKKTGLLSGLLIFLLATSTSFAQDSQMEEERGKKSKSKKTVDAVQMKDDDDIGNLRISGIDVVQNRVFSKRNRHEFSAGMGAIFDNPFLRYQLLQLRYTYHLREAFSVELGYERAFSQVKSLINQLENIECEPGEFFDADGNELTNCGVVLDPGPDPFENNYTFNLVWSPIYGKFSIFSKKIYHFDLSLTAGVGYYDTERNGYVGFNGGIGGKIFLNEWLAFRADIRNLTVKEGAPFNNIVNNRIFSLGFSTFFPLKNKRER